MWLVSPTWGNAKKFLGMADRMTGKIKLRLLSCAERVCTWKVCIEENFWHESKDMGLISTRQCAAWKYVRSKWWYSLNATSSASILCSGRVIGLDSPMPCFKWFCCCWVSSPSQFGEKLIFDCRNTSELWCINLTMLDYWHLFLLTNTKKLHMRDACGAATSKL